MRGWRQRPGTVTYTILTPVAGAEEKQSFAKVDAQKLGL
jgi:hypothetical protein